MSGSDKEGADKMAGKRSVIPFGPQHPVLPEPIHIDLVVEDEKVVEAVPSIGFVHRGLESLVTKKDFGEMVYVAERICGICSFGHGYGYVNAIENIMGIQPTDRARFIRTILFELSRMHSHILWLGLMADAFGFESLFMETWKYREKVLDMLESATGGRGIFSIIRIGGLRKDVPDDVLRGFLPELDKIEEGIRSCEKVFLSDPAVLSRLKGIGYLSKEDAQRLGCEGPFLRASGVAVDNRTRGYAAYGKIDFDIITSDEGDSYARCYVRIQEIYQSADIIRQCIEKIPGEGIYVPVKGFPNGEYMTVIEQPRGGACYYVHASGKKFIERMRVRTPTFANIPALAQMLQGCDVADVPILVVTVDPCISCTER